MSTNINNRGAAYKNLSLPVNKRVADLLKRMTLEEKIGQLNLKFGWECYKKGNDGIIVSEQFKKILAENNTGALYGTLRADVWTGITLENGLTPKQGAEAVNAIQKYAIENTRLGIPLLFSEECPHGHMAIGATVFPVPIAMASMWNPKLIEKVGNVIAKETRAQGGLIGYGPILDLAREPRWSRVEETFGEDPYLSSMMGAAMVKGLQGEGLSFNHTIVSTLKHFAAYGEPEGGHNAGAAHVGPRELREVLLSPFYAAVKQGARSIMVSYNEIDGVPCVCDKKLLTDTLRNEWGFNGFVVSDCRGIEVLSSSFEGRTYNVAGNFAEAANLALNAGVDMNLGGESYEAKYLLDAVKQEKISTDVIDRAVRRILRIKFSLGLFENPYVDVNETAGIVGCEAHRQLARKIARESLTLLKNKNDILPLKKNIKSIAVIGPNAHNIYNQLGDYTAPQPKGNVVTVLEGIKNKVVKNTIVGYALGCRIKDKSKGGFSEAIDIARKSDVAVVIMGGSSARDFTVKHAATGAAITNGEIGVSDMECGEGFDRSALNLAGVQLDLLKELYKTGVPLIIVLIKGRPLSINWIAENAHAIIDAWYPGEEGGNAIADVLFGDYNPAGRLPVSIPKSAGQLPVYYNHKPLARSNYVFLDNKPLYPFGFGLSYTKFKYHNLKISPEKISSKETAVVSIDVTNIGEIAGDEVVQMYVNDEISSVTRPVKELKDFKRIHLLPGETKKITFTISQEKLKFYDINMNYTAEPGKFKIMVGGNQTELILC